MKRGITGVVGMVTWLCAAGAHAADRQAEAHGHFMLGVECVQAGKISASIAEFEAAYAISPRFPVLYNLGQAYALTGRAALAVRTLRRYLADGGSNIDATRREHVEAVIREQEARTGRLRVSTLPVAARLSLDGQPFSVSELDALVDAGRHELRAALDGYETSLTTVDVAARGSENVVFHLRPSTLAAPGWLEVACSTPNVELDVDGRRVGRVPSASPLMVPAGARQLRFQRTGYAPFEIVVAVPPAEVTRADCGLTRSRTSEGGATAALDVKATQTGARVLVDGTTFRGERMPPGIHDVEVLRDGFEPWSRRVSLPPRQVTSVVAPLQPTPARRAREARAAGRTRTLAYLAGGSGVALGIIATGLYAINSQRYSTWRANALENAEAMANGGTTPEERARSGDLHEEAIAIERSDHVAIALGAGAVALVVTSAVLFVSAAKLDRGARAVGYVWDGRAVTWRY